MPILCFSIAIHERIDIVLEQVGNVLTMCPGSRIVLHVNRAFAAALEADPVQAALYRQLRRHPDVIVNPDHLATRRRHMFHAHISNIAFLKTANIPYDTMVLLSSSDLIVRPGYADFIAEWGAGTHTTPYQPEGWNAAMFADPIAPALMRAAGADQLRGGAYEGSFYRRDVIERMVAILNGLIPDWDYNDAHPKEEVFFQTLLTAFPDLRVTEQPSHQLGFDPAEDALVLRRVLRRLGLCAPNTSALLAEWDAMAPHAGEIPDGDEDNGPYVLSHVPRLRDNLVRMLLTDATPDGVSARARFIAARLLPTDLLQLELPGRMNPSVLTQHASAAAGGGIKPVSHQASNLPYLLPALLTTPVQPILPSNTLAPTVGLRVTLPASPDGVTPPHWVDRRDETGLIYGVSGERWPEPGTVIVSRSAEGSCFSCQPGDAGWQDARLALLCPMPTANVQTPIALIRLRPASISTAEIWFSWVIQAPGKERQFISGTRLTHVTAATLNLWTVIPAANQEQLRVASIKGQLWAYLTLPVTTQPIEILEYGYLRELSLAVTAVSNSGCNTLITA